MGPGHLFDPGNALGRALGSSGQPGGGGTGGGDFYTPIQDPDDILTLVVDGSNNFYYTVNWPDFLTEFYSQVDIQEVFPVGVALDILQVDGTSGDWVARGFIEGPFFIGDPAVGDITSYLQITYDNLGDRVIIQPPGVDDNVISVYQQSGSGFDLRFKLMVDNDTTGANLLGWDPTGMIQTFDIRQGRLSIDDIPAEGTDPVPNVYYDGFEFKTTLGGGSGSVTSSMFVLKGTFDACVAGSTALSPAIPSGSRFIPFGLSTIAVHCTALTGSPSNFTIELGSNAGFDNLRTAVVVSALDAVNDFSAAISYTATESIDGTVSVNVTVADGTATSQTVEIYVIGFLSS